VFEDLLFGGVEGDVGEVDAQGSFCGVLVECGGVVSDSLEGLLVGVVGVVGVVSMVVHPAFDSILAIEVVVLIDVAILLLKENPLKVLILVMWRVLTFSIAIVVIVVLVVPASVLVEEVDVSRVFYFEAFTVGELGEDLETVGGWCVVGLHDK